MAARDGVSPQSLSGEPLVWNIVCSTFALIASQSFFSDKEVCQLLEGELGRKLVIQGGFVCFLFIQEVVNKELKST